MRRRRFLKSILAGSLALGTPPRRGAVAKSGTGRVHDCIVVGGGISGLSAAYVLGDRDVLVLEATASTGGRVQSGNWLGWDYAQGAEYIGRPDGLFARMIGDLGLRPVEIPFPMDIYAHDEQLWKGARGRRRLLVKKGGFRAYNRFLLTLYETSLHYEAVPKYTPDGPLARLDGITCREWFEEMRLPPIYLDLFNVTIRGLFGANLDEISALGAFEEIAFDFAGQKPYRPESNDESSFPEHSTKAFTFPRGIAEFTDALARRLGERCRPGVVVERIQGNDRDGFTVYSTDPFSRSFQSRRVILAVPAPVAVKIGAAVLSHEQMALLRRIHFAPYVTVTVFTDTAILAGGFDLAVPDGHFFTDIYDATWIQRQTDPGGREGFVTTFTVAPLSRLDKTILKMTDADLITTCLRDLARVRPGWIGSVKGYDVRRYVNGFPVMTLGAYQRLTRLHRSLTGHVQLAGDSLIYPTIEGAIAAGEIAARRLLRTL